MMRLLRLYVTVLPALRHRHARKSYARWIMVLAMLGVMSTAVSLACFVCSPAVSRMASVSDLQLRQSLFCSSCGRWTKP
ncbi:hypothetical protein QBC46DRAFT_388141 [Diplogelasinospora grovesii]|uniref:Uncharacterized protein n=1 Tax=Diplogelasinospora grovesii TaxID=303347 RepID=A0AAN6N6W2_9PEZI|nr:hypothetical protein QBC46DRAFT_388141 [Diplogelasinospora grovesii]